MYVLPRFPALREPRGALGPSPERPQPREDAWPRPTRISCTSRAQGGALGPSPERLAPPYPHFPHFASPGGALGPSPERALRLSSSSPSSSPLPWEYGAFLVIWCLFVFFSRRGRLPRRINPRSSSDGPHVPQGSGESSAEQVRSDPEQMSCCRGKNRRSPSYAKCISAADDAHRHMQT